jgi:sugar phosphate isomerase/epimerase
VKVSDWNGSHACALGKGDIPNAEAIEALGAANYSQWVTFEFPAAWAQVDGAAEKVLAESAKALYSWIGSKPKPGGQRQASKAGQV